MMKPKPLRLGGRARAILVLGVAALLLGGVAIWLMQPERSETAGTPRTAEEARGFLSRLPGFGGIAEGDFRVRELIGAVDVEKAKICPGEDVRITVRTDPAKVAEGMRLEASVNGLPAGEAVLRFGSPGVRQFYVAATDGEDGLDFRTGTVQVLSLKDPACVTRPRLTLFAYPVLEETYRFEILEVQNVAAERFRWEFGDGTVQETTGRTIEHSFLGRTQTTPKSVFHVRVTAPGSGGATAEARHTVIFQNTFFATKHAGSPQIPSEYSAYMPPSAGGHQAEVRFANPDPVPIRLEQVRLTLHPCDGSGSREVEMPASKVFGGDVLRPGVNTLRLRIQVPGPELCAAQVHIEGDTVPPRAGSPLPGGQGTIARTTAMMSFTMRAPDKKQVAARQAALDRDRRLLIAGDEVPLPEGAQDKGRKTAPEDGPQPEEVTR